jgi:hypothetical protein
MHYVILSHYGQIDVTKIRRLFFLVFHCELVRNEIHQSTPVSCFYTTKTLREVHDSSPGCGIRYSSAIFSVFSLYFQENLWITFLNRSRNLLPYLYFWSLVIIYIIRKSIQNVNTPPNYHSTNSRFMCYIYIRFIYTCFTIYNFHTYSSHYFNTFFEERVTVQQKWINFDYWKLLILKVVPVLN